MLKLVTSLIHAVLGTVTLGTGCVMLFLMGLPFTLLMFLLIL